MPEYDDANLVPDPARFAGLDTPSGDALFPEGAADGPRGAVIRAAADGELTPEQASTVDAGDAIAFERSLRDATARAMGGVTAPAGLCEAILSQARGGRPEDDALADAMHARGEETRDRSFWSAGRGVAALAAAVLLAVVGVMVWQGNPAPGQGAGASGGALATIGGVDTAYRTNLARFVADEHSRTLDDRYAERKFTAKVPSEAADAIKADLHGDPVIPPCGGATKFAGASPCGVPGKGPSAHMQFVLPVHDANGEIVPDATGRKVSVFVKQDKGELAIAEGTTYLVNAQACNRSDVYICVWRRDGLLYTLVSEGRNEPMCTKFLAQFGVEPPDPANSI